MDSAHPETIAKTSEKRTNVQDVWQKREIMMGSYLVSASIRARRVVTRRLRRTSDRRAQRVAAAGPRPGGRASRHKLKPGSIASPATTLTSLDPRGVARRLQHTNTTTTHQNPTHRTTPVIPNMPRGNRRVTTRGTNPWPARKQALHNEARHHAKSKRPNITPPQALEQRLDGQSSTKTQYARELAPTSS